MRLRVTAEGLPDLNNVIERLQQALDKGLDVEDAETAEGMMSGALMERATTLMQVVNSNSIGDDRIKQILRLIISDLRRCWPTTTHRRTPTSCSASCCRFPVVIPTRPAGCSPTFLKAEDVAADERAEAYMLRARVQTDEKKALEDFDAAIELVPDNTNFKLIRAMYLRSKEKFDDALAAVDKMIGQSPEDANALILQGEIFREMGKPDDALKSFEAAIKLAPESPGPYQNRGEIYREKEEYDKAIQEFTKVVEFQPGDVLPLVHRAEAYLHAGSSTKRSPMSMPCWRSSKSWRHIACAARFWPSSTGWTKRSPRCSSSPRPYRTSPS